MSDIEKVMSGIEGLTWDDWSDYHSDSEVQNIAKDALELLKEQEKELERLKKCRHNCKIDCLLEKYEALKKENEELKEELEASNGANKNLIERIGEFGKWLPVHCKDCKHVKSNWKRDVFGNTLYVCELLSCNQEHEVMHTGEWFCADGEKK